MHAALFPDFLNDPQQYRDAQKYWQDQWQIVVQQHSLTAWKSPWLTTTFADGTEQGDGNPIFSAIRMDSQVGVRVVQLDPAEDGDEFSYWYDEFGESPQKVQELVISCVLTYENASRALGIITEYVKSGGRSRISA